MWKIAPSITDDEVNDSDRHNDDNGYDNDKFFVRVPGFKFKKVQPQIRLKSKIHGQSSWRENLDKQGLPELILW